jgi:Cdc6-like AAA superfamily ATPase
MTAPRAEQGSEQTEMEVVLDMAGATAPDWMSLSYEAGRVFRPNAPVDEKALFSGRLDQVRQIMDAVYQIGQHAILYGERGVGKTSLANVLQEFLSEADDEGVSDLVIRVNCDTADTFDSVWKKVFGKVVSSREKRRVGFTTPATNEAFTAAELLAEQEISIETVRRLLEALSATPTVTVIIIDEFDRLSPQVRGVFADLVKTLSDQAIDATVVMVGVADSVDGLIDSHHSVARALSQVPMPRMTRREIEQIVDTGLARLEMTIDPDAKRRIVLLSQGLPYYAHLISLHACRAAADAARLEISEFIVDAAIAKAIESAQQSVRKAYTDGTYSARKQNLFADVLLACALAQANEAGFFSPQNVRDPLCKITGKDYDIPTFAQHLNDFASDKRNRILVKEGHPRRFVFRFSDPLMQPYVVMLGLANGQIPASLLDSI